MKDIGDEVCVCEKSNKDLVNCDDCFFAYGVILNHLKASWASIETNTKIITLCPKRFESSKILDVAILRRC